MLDLIRHLWHPDAKSEMPEMQHKKRLRRRLVVLKMVLVLGVAFWFGLPDALFSDPVSTVTEDRRGQLLGAHIAADGQWRFPPSDSVPDRFVLAIERFEDKRFRSHWGVDPLAMARAIYLNLKTGGVVSGGSTLTMQVIRLSRKGKSRTIREKLLECAMALRLELRYSKDEIMALYASHAPFGGNVVGLEAAAWRYFGRSATHLSWAEACMLAVLPNSPALIHPGRNRELLVKKRNRLLKRLADEQLIDHDTYLLSIDEEIPDKPSPFPNTAPHLLQYIRKEKGDLKARTTIDQRLQERVQELVNRHTRRLAANRIHNIAVLVTSVRTGEVLAYVGNVKMTDRADRRRFQTYVDVVQAPRSTGSVLKPMLYAAMLSAGSILPNALVSDIPTNLGGYTPKNYNLGYDGAIPAHRALARSLNVPAVKMLQSYGVEKLHYIFRKSGLTTISYPPKHYGLSLILGGCEATLWDLCGAYASMARSLVHYPKYSGQYDPADYHPPVCLANEVDSLPAPNHRLQESGLYGASALWLTMQALRDVERPQNEAGWEYFSSSRRIAWKTGTSFGFRDAWSVGITPDYVVGVWAGNANGEGRPQLVGLLAAAPILFDVFALLPVHNEWFDTPFDDMAQTDVCAESGFLASPICPNTKTELMPLNAQRFKACPYHRMVHLDATGQWQVHSGCEPVASMQHKPWFVLPPAMEWYYKNKSPDYKVLPPFRNDCRKDETATATHFMQLIYPKNNVRIYVPVELDSKRGRTVFEAVHRNPQTAVFWYIDELFVGRTVHSHKLGINPKPGKHKLTLVDENGEMLHLDFEILQGAAD